MLFDNPTKDASEKSNNLLEKKEKIYSILKIRGPCLPVHVTKQTELSMLFASTLLSELVAYKRIKISNMKVGSSPVYYLPGQEEQLERFSTHLPGKEKEAFAMLKEKQILEDKKQEPAIRVALRQIKDFAIPIQIENKLFWRFHSIQEEKADELIKDSLEKEKSTEAPKQEEKEEIKEEEIKPEIEIKKTKESIKPKSKERLDIFDKPKKAKKKANKSKSTKKEDKLFSDIKEHLAQKQIEILGIEGIAKDELTLKVKENNQEYLLIALNKKRVDEKDILKAYKKALGTNMKFKLLSFGEPLKKINDLLTAFESMHSIEKIEK